MAIVADRSGNNPTDRPYKTHNRTNAGKPSGSLTPQYAGEIILDTTNDVRWRALGTDNDSWVPMESEVT